MATTNLINQRRRDSWLQNAAKLAKTRSFCAANGRECYVGALDEQIARCEQIAALFDADDREAAKALETEAFAAADQNSVIRV